MISKAQSLDMATIDSPVSATTFVKAPEIQEISQNRDIPKSMNIAPQNDHKNIKDIQNYLHNDEINDIIGKKYNGPIDGIINKELESVANCLELEISKIIDENISGLILTTTAADIQKTIKLITAFKKTFNINSKFSQDQRIYELGKIKMIKK